MAANIPAALKSADIGRYALRAGQLEKAKPSISYWCNYWIVNQLISKGLHNADDECTRYTTDLMDKLERAKTEHSDDDTIMDDLAAQVFVEQFATETLQRADNAMKANKSSRQTADTLAAAIVFLELRQIWESMDAETSSKVKYAKYHATRILKAIRAGEDPNLSNPAAEPGPAAERPLEGADPDVQMLDQTPADPVTHRASVEEVPDEHDGLERHMAQRSAIDQSLHPSRAPSIPRPPEQRQVSPGQTPHNADNAENFYSQAPIPDVSPLQSPERGRNNSTGGGYFPRTPDDSGRQDSASGINNQSGNLELPSPPSLPDISSPPPPIPSVPGVPPIQPSQRMPGFPSNGIDPTSFNGPSAGTAPYTYGQSRVPPSQAHGPSQPSAPPPLPQPPRVQAHRVVPSSLAEEPSRPSAVVDEEAMAKAQKHARWAISALNFEDVNTAIQELNGALKSLGA
ncbi:MAG: hypothetical protein Q9183_001558, partial [Haloplaca sp. 2 TL-2023]